MLPEDGATPPDDDPPARAAALIRDLKGPDRTLWGFAFQGLLDLTDARVGPILFAALGDIDPRVRLAVAACATRFAAGPADAGRIFDAVGPLLAGGDPGLRDEARRVLWWVRPRPPAVLEDLVGALSDPASRSAALIVLCDDPLYALPGLPAVVGALEAPDAGTRGHAAVLLGLMGAAAGPAIGALIRRLDDPEERVRVYAACAITQVDPAREEALPALMRGLGSPYPDWRAYSATALGRMGARAAGAAAALRGLAADAYEPAHRAAEEALTRIGAAGA